MMTFEHTSADGKASDDHPAPILPEVFLVICALVLLPFTLLGLFFWGVWKVRRM